MKHALLALMLSAMPLAADPIADLSQPAEAAKWRFFTDGVMGGVSTGEAVLDDGALTLTGTVSTKNNGGFIQVRRGDIALPAEADSLTIRVRGDGQTYYLHMRTRATRLPWQYYQAPFTAPETWQEITLPLSAFKPSGALLPGTPKAASVTSIALVAYGRDHAANVSLATIRAD